MTRFAKLAAPLFAVALLLSLTALTQADDKTNADVTLDGVDLGTHVLGAEMKADDLKGKVVVFEYWGDRCPPCIASIPGLVKTKAAWEKAGGDDSITVVNHGKLKGAEHRGVPHAYVLDHTGKLIWKGNPHPRAGGKEMKEVVKKAAKAVPDKA